MEYSKLEYKLGFSQIRNSIKEMCLSSGGKEFVDKIIFSDNYDKILKLLNLTHEFRLILLRNETFPNSNFIDMRLILERIRTMGSFIRQKELFDLKLSLRTINECLEFFSNMEDEKYPFLSSIGKNVYVDKDILKYSERLIDAKGEFFDNASEELYLIRSNKRRKLLEVDKRIEKLLSISKKEGWSVEDSEITFRNGRLVIPISASYKKKIGGIIHDESQSGQTSYIEPTEIVELNNEVRELEMEERREIVKILTEFTNNLRPNIDTLIHAYYFLSHLDFIRAKAKYSLEIGAVMPIVENKPLINWFDARHPLLEKSLQKNAKKIIPLRIELNDKGRILIISGPNAGGKSVCLKTVGLLQYMLQCGILIPLRETSEMGIFSSIFIDIGDEQSVENDLSTYSSHLLNMKGLVKLADSNTLFLIDECGSGTDPIIGGSIAETILEHLNSRYSYGIVTTHYSNLKLLSDREEGILNGAMLFDKDNMCPLYKLLIGKPGSSFAFEIAERIGLPKEIINKAIEKIGSSHLDFEIQLQELEVEKIGIKKKEEELRVADEFLSEVLEKYNKLNLKLEEEKSLILKEAKKEAKEIILNANRKIENTISQIKESNADKTKTKTLRQQLQKHGGEIEKDIHILDAKTSTIKEKLKNSPKKDIGIRIDYSPLQIGDIVRVGYENNYAEVLNIKGNKVELALGSIKMRVMKDELIKVDKKAYFKMEESKTKNRNSSFGNIINELNQKRSVFKSQLDLRGKKMEDALDEVSKFIDEARLLGERELSILHGKGDGILKTAIRQYLSSVLEVKYFRPAPLEFGGEGITLVSLN